MIRGTTPTHTFTLPFDTRLVEKGYVSYKQVDRCGTKVELHKEFSMCQCNENTVTVQLTQEETLTFKAGCMVEIQLKVKMRENAEVLASDPIVETVEKILHKEVI